MFNIRCMCTMALIMMLITACGGPAMKTKATEFPLMYKEYPVSILILPPVNESNVAEAMQYYSTTIQESLSFNGYYTFPYPITTEILGKEGIYNNDLIAELPLSKYKELFGADAVLFTTIRKWDLNYKVLESGLSITMDCILKSVQSGRIMWQYSGTIIVDLSGGDIELGFAGLISRMVVTAVKSATADYFQNVRKVNATVLSSMPYGKYHPQHNKDQKFKFDDHPFKKIKKE